LRYFRYGKISTVSILENNPYLIAIMSSAFQTAHTIVSTRYSEFIQKRTFCRKQCQSFPLVKRSWVCHGIADMTWSVSL